MPGAALGCEAGAVAVAAGTTGESACSVDATMVPTLSTGAAACPPRPQAITSAPAATANRIVRRLFIFPSRNRMEWRPGPAPAWPTALCQASCRRFYMEKGCSRQSPDGNGSVLLCGAHVDRLDQRIQRGQGWRESIRGRGIQLVGHSLEVAA